MRKLLTLTAILMVFFTACKIEEPEPIIIVEYGVSVVSKNQTVDLGDTLVNTDKQYVFKITNEGTDTLNLKGAPPVKVDCDVGVFELVHQQLSSSKIASGSSETFSINFKPKEEKTYTATVTVSSNDPMNKKFTFTISAKGVIGKPIIEIFHGNTLINHEGTINMGEMFLAESKPITVTIKIPVMEFLILILKVS